MLFLHLSDNLLVTPKTHVFIRLHTPYPASLCVIVEGLKSSFMTMGVVQVHRHNSDKWIEMAGATETQQQTCAAVSRYQMTGFCLSRGLISVYLFTSSLFFFSCSCSHVSSGTYRSLVESLMLFERGCGCRVAQ